LNESSQQQNPATGAKTQCGAVRLLKLVIANVINIAADLGGMAQGAEMVRPYIACRQY
jgi:hypothetical protein